MNDDNYGSRLIGDIRFSNPCAEKAKLVLKELESVMERFEVERIDVSWSGIRIMKEKMEEE